MRLGRDKSVFFVEAFKQFKSEGREWMRIEELPPVAATHDEKYMRRRAMLNKFLGLVGVERGPLPNGLRYPPEGNIYQVIDDMVQNGVIEKDIAAEPIEHWIYRLADSEPETQVHA